MDKNSEIWQPPSPEPTEDSSLPATLLLTRIHAGEAGEAPNATGLLAGMDPEQIRAAQEAALAESTQEFRDAFDRGLDEEVVTSHLLSISDKPIDPEHLDESSLRDLAAREQFEYLMRTLGVQETVQHILEDFDRGPKKNLHYPYKPTSRIYNGPGQQVQLVFHEENDSNVLAEIFAKKFDASKALFSMQSPLLNDYPIFGLDNLPEEAAYQQEVRRAESALEALATGTPIQEPVDLLLNSVVQVGNDGELCQNIVRNIVDDPGEETAMNTYFNSIALDTAAFESEVVVQAWRDIEILASPDNNPNYSQAREDFLNASREFSLIIQDKIANIRTFQTRYGPGEFRLIYDAEDNAVVIDKFTIMPAEAA